LTLNPFNKMESKTQRKILEEWIRWKASSDLKFRNRVMSNPGETLESVFGVSIPESLNIRILTEEKNQFILVIPHLQKAEDELSEKELETVAGGWSGGTDCGTCLEDGCTYSCDDSLC